MKLTITSPLAGKTYCLDKYKSNIENLIFNKSQTTFIIWDNSNDPDFGGSVRTWADTVGFVGVIYHEDPTPKKTIETGADYGKISDRVVNILSEMFTTLVPADSDFVLNIEDDVTVPPDALLKMFKIMEDPRVTTVEPAIFGRRLKDRAFGVAQAWKFKESRVYPIGDTSDEKTIAILKVGDKPYGVEIVGSSSTGFWLTRYSVLKELGWKIEDGVRGGDISWGYRLWKHDKGWFVIDWSIYAKHWWEYNGKVGYFSYEHRKEDIYGT